jgi:dTDP-4-amino-4,6-dideoxygalactose transaminase
MLLLEAMGLKGAEVLCPAYTCVVVAHAIVHSGNEPRFVDSRDDDFNMDLDLAERAITDKIGAIIATSIFGYPVDLDRLDHIRERHPQLKVIQDCAHSFGAQFKGRSVQGAGNAAIYGLNVSKLITSIFGGMVTTDDDALAARLRALRKDRLAPATFAKSVRRLLYLLAVYPAFSQSLYGLVHALERSRMLDRFVKYYDEANIDMPPDYLETMSPIEARVGVAQITKYAPIIARRREVAQYYDEQLRSLSRLRLPPIVDGATYSHYVVRVDRRDALLERALQRGVQLGTLIEYSIPEMPAYQARALAGQAACPIASRMAQMSVNLPLCCGLKGAAQTVKVLREIA